MTPVPSPIRVLLFDVNETLLDLSPLHSSIDQFLNMPNASKLWFTRLLQYSLVMTVSQQFAPFTEIAASTLKMLAINNDIESRDEDIKKALSPMSALSSYAEVPEALATLKEKGYRMAALSNSSQSGLDSQLEYSGLSNFFEKMLSVEKIQKYKPHIDVYRWAAKTMEVDIDHCMLVAAHGWDVAGAKWSGMQTAFIRRPGQQLFPLAGDPDLQLRDLTDLANAL